MLAHLIGLIQQLYGDTEFVKTLFSTRQALEKQATGRTFLKRRHLVGDMGKYATLCWNIPFVGGFLDGVENAQGVLNRLGNRVHADNRITRSEEHTSELQSRPHLVCRLLLEKKKKKH